MQRRLWSIRIALCTLVCLNAASAHADGMRCGSKLVSEGDSPYQVRTVCGSPDSENQWVEYRTMRRWVSTPCFQDRGVVRCGYVEELVVPVAVEQWFYDFGPHSLVRHLTFEQGRLLRVATGGYGTKL